MPLQPAPITPAASFAAILFPADEDRPRIIKVDCLAETQSSGPCVWTPITYPHIGGAREPASLIITQGVGGASLRFPIQLHYRPDFDHDGSPVNKPIHRLSTGQSTIQWRGNVLALKFSGTRRQGYTDITMNDLSSLVAYFLTK
jgi:hypothetical protein